MWQNRLRLWEFRTIAILLCPCVCNMRYVNIRSLSPKSYVVPRRGGEIILNSESWNGFSFPTHCCACVELGKTTCCELVATCILLLQCRSSNIICDCESRVVGRCVFNNLAEGSPCSFIYCILSAFLCPPLFRSFAVK